MLGSLASRAHSNTVSNPSHRHTISIPPSSASSITSSSTHSIPSLDPPPKATNLKPINFINNYVPPTDALATTPAQKFSAMDTHKFEEKEQEIEKKEKTKERDDEDDEYDEEVERERNRREREIAPINKYSLNNDPPTRVTGVESRFYKFGVPDPSITPPRIPTKFKSFFFLYR